MIGDLEGSRDLPHRAAVQSHFEAVLRRLNEQPAGLLSPYTITLGDEFQAVLSDPGRLFCDLVQIQATLRQANASARFACAAGTLHTPVNPAQAIGMDGPAFHRARAGVEQLKAQGQTFAVAGLDGAVNDLANAALSLASDEMARWQDNRHIIFAERLRGRPVKTIAKQLGISDAAVYKNIDDGGLKHLQATFQAIEALLQARLVQAP